MTEETTTAVEITEPTDTETVEVTETPAPESTALADELAEVRKALKKANREAAERRRALDAFEKAEQERKQAEMSEMEKLQAKVAAMEARAQEAEAARELLEKRQQFYTAIGTANLQWANEQARQDAAALVDLSEMDGPEDAAEIVKGLQKDRPYLFAQTTPPDIDGRKRGKATTAEAQEEAIRLAAAKYGAMYVPPD